MREQINEKTPGDLVTIADHEAEARLTEALAGLIPGSRVVGEEAVSVDPGLLDGLDQGCVWLVDPLDGTGNFVAGSPHFDNRYFRLFHRGGRKLPNSLAEDFTLGYSVSLMERSTEVSGSNRTSTGSRSLP